MALGYITTSKQIPQFLQQVGHLNIRNTSSIRNEHLQYSGQDNGASVLQSNVILQKHNFKHSWEPGRMLS